MTSSGWKSSRGFIGYYGIPNLYLDDGTLNMTTVMQVLGMLGAAVGINMTFLYPYSLLKKGWGKSHRKLAKWDLGMTMFLPFTLVTSLVIIAMTVGGVYTGEDVVVTGLKPIGAAQALAGVLGQTAGRTIFDLGLIGMTCGAISTHMVVCGFTFSEIFRVFGAAESKTRFRLFALTPAIGMLGVIITLPMWFPVAASAVCFTMLPVAYLAFLIMNNKVSYLGDAVGKGATPRRVQHHSGDRSGHVRGGLWDHGLQTCLDSRSGGVGLDVNVRRIHTSFVKNRPSRWARLDARPTNLERVSGCGHVSRSRALYDHVVQGIFESVGTGDRLVVDGRAGRFFVHPEDKTLRAYRNLQRECVCFRDRLSHEPAGPAQPMEFLWSCWPTSPVSKMLKRSAGIGLCRTVVHHHAPPILKSSFLRPCRFIKSYNDRGLMPLRRAVSSTLPLVLPKLIDEIGLFAGTDNGIADVLPRA